MRVASGFVSITAPRRGPLRFVSSIRFRYKSVSDRAVCLPVAIASCRLLIVASSSSNAGSAPRLTSEFCGGRSPRGEQPRSTALPTASDATVLRTNVLRFIRHLRRTGPNDDGKSEQACEKPVAGKRDESGGIRSLGHPLDSASYTKHI